MASNSLTPDQWLIVRERLRAGKVAPEAVKGIAHETKKREAEIRGAMSFWKAVSMDADDKEWLTFAQTGELPGAVKLSPSQMEAARGGFAFMIGWAIGSAIYNAYATEIQDLLAG